MRVLDTDEVEFFLEKLNNCSLWDTYKILNCKRKTLFQHERAFLIKKDRLNIWGKSDFYLQKISLPRGWNTTKEDFCLMENAVEELCNSISEIKERTWWMYAANHSSGHLRIIAGIGKGIVLSRFLPTDSNTSQEVSKTVMYLQRFGMNKDMKFFSPLSRIEIHSKIGSEIACEKINIKKSDNMEKVIHDFLSNNSKVQSIIISSSYLERFLDTKILYPILLVMTLIVLIVNQCIRDSEKVIASLKGNTHVTIENMQLKIDRENFPVVKRLINTLKDSRDPAELFQKASKIRRKYNILIERLSLEKEIKIQTSLTTKTFNELKSDRDIEKIIQISNSEYEELGSNKKFGAIICIK
ncbi:MAG: hypothetical protein LBQ08_02195 [Holosporaceae bacterium]|jgi:hypothetical protein|nr:hypothetical protein [Holosporaceae bacterium]